MNNGSVPRYHLNGTGRDTYVNNLSDYKSNLILDAMCSPRNLRLIGVPSKYHSDGTGRDCYVVKQNYWERDNKGHVKLPNILRKQETSQEKKSPYTKKDSYSSKILKSKEAELIKRIYFMPKKAFTNKNMDFDQRIDGKIYAPLLTEEKYSTERLLQLFNYRNKIIG